MTNFKQIIDTFFVKTSFIVLLCIGGGLSIRSITGEPIVCMSQGVPGIKNNYLKCLRNNISEKIVSSFCRYNIYIYKDQRILKVWLLSAFIISTIHLFSKYDRDLTSEEKAYFQKFDHDGRIAYGLNNNKEKKDKIHLDFIYWTPFVILCQERSIVVSTQYIIFCIIAGLSVLYSKNGMEGIRGKIIEDSHTSCQIRGRSECDIWKVVGDLIDYSDRKKYTFSGSQSTLVLLRMEIWSTISYVNLWI